MSKKESPRRQEGAPASSFGVQDRSKFKKGHQCSVILLFPGIRILKWTSLAQNGAMKEMPSIIACRVVDVAISKEVSAW